uniref:Epidermal cell surface receptor isoform X1 n=1 Tax=Diabrotica virgifera virgifera TaxID=50390 RepID=A0A6P7FGH2_DIAVI
MTRRYLVVFLGFVLLVAVSDGTTQECIQGSTAESCGSSPTDNDIKKQRSPQDLTSHTAKPPELPQAMSMLAEDSDAPFQPTPVPVTESNIVDKNSAKINSSAAAEEPKGRALNFTLGGHENDNVLMNPTNHSGVDLSDVSIGDDDDDFDMEMLHPKILSPKAELKNASYVPGKTCEQGGLTYENGVKIENGCDSICTCTDGSMKCTDRCKTPFFRKGKKIDDPHCFAKSVEDECCSILVCSDDADNLEEEPIEFCSYKNKTLNRGDIYKEECSEICKCEAGGKMSCKPRCPPATKTSDRCVEVPNPADPCCKKVLCDVTLEENESDKDDERNRKVLSARFVNSTTMLIKLDPKIEVSENTLVVEVSDDKVNWQKHKVSAGGYVTAKNTAKYLKLENTEDIINVQNFEGNPKETKKDKNKPSGRGCQYKDKFFNIGEEFNDNCSSLCVCQDGGMKCLKLQCPTYFGVDVLDPNCVEWETIPPNFIASPPNCCPSSIRCKNNGSCAHEGVTYKNWEQLPANVTGCEKQCYCEMGKIECQNTCPPIEAHPPPNLPCPPHMARPGHLPDDDCCKVWVCGNDQNPVKENNKTNKNVSKSPFFGPFSPSKPSKTLGPLAVYENGDSSKESNSVMGTATKPVVAIEENPYYHKKNGSKIDKSSASTPSKSDKTKNTKTPVFVTPPSTISSDISTVKSVDSPIHSEIEIHGHGNAEELLQFINQHPELSNYPSGSVLEIHSIPTSSKQEPNSISNGDKSHIHLVPYVVPQNSAGERVPSNLPPGFSLEQLLNEFHRNTLPNGQGSLPPLPNINRPFLGPQSIPLPNRSNISHPGISNIFPGPFNGYNQPEDDILVHTLEAIDPRTVRLAFMVPPVIVNLHGRVEVRYTNNKKDDNLDAWMLQVFAPPNDLIATPSLEFDLQDLKPNTEYKIKITITLRDIHTTHSSRIYKIKTPRDIVATTLPPMIPIEPELAITDINSTWVTVVWKKFDENELRFIDGVQLRFREIDGKIYAATPLIHRAVTSYTLEKLKPNTKYEIGIFFIPFPGQLTELHAEHMLHFTTANEVDTYGFNVTLEISLIKSQNVELSWSGVPYPEDKYVNIYRAIYQSDSGKEDQSIFKIAKRDSPTKTIVSDLKPGTRYRLWLEVYLTNGKIKTSNVQDFITKPRTAPSLGASTQQDKLSRAEHLEPKGDYYGPLVIVAILAAIAILSTLVLLLILIRRHNQNKAAITPPSRINQSAYDNPSYKVEIQQETMGL